MATDLFLFITGNGLNNTINQIPCRIAILPLVMMLPCLKGGPVEKNNGALRGGTPPLSGKYA